MVTGTLSLQQRLTRCLDSATKSEQAIANYVLTNLREIPFETAASLARKIGVSELTVGRFCRSLGFRHFKQLKAELKDDLGDRPWLIADRLQEVQRRSAASGDQLAKSLELELAALVKVYELAQSDTWKPAIERLAYRPRVYIAGFQTERGLAAYLAHQLQYLRDGVHLLDLTGGNIAEALLAPPDESCLVIFDSRRYSRISKLMIEKAHAAGIPVTLIADPFCTWARGQVSELFVVPTDLNFVWDCTSQMASLVNLMINGVFTELGARVESRMNQIADLYSSFFGYVDDGRDRSSN
jgi:DNA-binding MurR/RpiR family transcriptional regulator